MNFFTVQKQRKFIISILLFFLFGCGEPVIIPLSKAEQVKLNELRNELEVLKSKQEALDNEKTRINKIEKTYLEKGLRIKHLKVKKVMFDDGRERACYSGTIRNTGSEIVQEINAEISFYDSKSKKLINKWNVAVVSANDEFLANTEDAKLKAAIYTLSGQKLPLKPKETVDLSKGKSCQSEVTLGWEAKDTVIKIVSLKIRPKLEDKNYNLKRLQLMSESNFFDLQKREAASL